MRKLIIIVLLLVLLTVVSMLTGCGKVTSGLGLIAEGIGDGISSGGRFIQESSRTEKGD